MLTPLEMYEAAEERIAMGHASPEIKVSAVLALARGGALELALQRFEEYGLGALVDNEDALALRGRLYKDNARFCKGAERLAALTNGAEAYHEAWRRTGGVYSAINAATLYILKGDIENGHKIARDILVLLDWRPPATAPESLYYQYASKAEALLLLHKEKDAQAVMHKAIGCDPENYAAHAVTIKQFELILDQSGGAKDWLDGLRPPMTCFYSGRMPEGGECAASLDALQAAIAAFLDTHRIGAAYGALAAGSDILFAEAILARGASLRVILPCAPTMFVKQSVAPFGEQWRDRFANCLAQATRVSQVSGDEEFADECALELAGRLAMGRAIEDANLLSTQPIQALIQPNENSLTQRFESIWTASWQSLKSVTLAKREPIKPSARSQGTGFPKADRCLAAMLFADLTGFGALDDTAVMRVVRHVLTSLADVLHTEEWLHLNSWGDGLFVVSEKPKNALNLALKLQEKMSSLDLSAHCLPQTLALRVGLHYGPVTRMPDPITQRESVFGAEVAYAARIEPLAVPGAIWASEAYISALALDKPMSVSSRYIGRKKLKGQGEAVRLFAINGLSALPQEVR